MLGLEARGARRRLNVFLAGEALCGRAERAQQPTQLARLVRGEIAEEPRELVLAGAAALHGSLLCPGLEVSLEVSPERSAGL